MSVWRWLVGLIVWLIGRRLPFRRTGTDEDAGADRRAPKQREGRIVAAGPPARSAENVVLVLLGLATLFAIGFIVAYAEFSPAKLPDELLGIGLGGCFLFIGAAFTVVAKHLVVTEELEDEYPQPHPEAQADVLEIIHESGSRITRKRLLVSAGAITGGAVGLAALAPALSLGPLWDTAPLDRTPWRRGIRLVDVTGRPFRAPDVAERTFYTAFPEGADMQDIASPVVMIRLDPAKLQLPSGRSGWAPHGIVAYSKICTHAGCAIGLYRKPTFPVVEPQDALVCPCHYSTFDPARGGEVIYGPAGRPLPQLPLLIDSAGNLRAAGNFSGPVGPSWWGVRNSKAQNGPD